MSRFKEKFNRLKQKINQDPLPESFMNPFERRAQAMANDMSILLEKIYPKDPNFGYTPIQWAVRTSMKDLQNAQAFSEVLEDVQEFLPSAPSHLDIQELRDYFSLRGDQIDQHSSQGAYVVVEYNIDYRRISYAQQRANQFLHVLNTCVTMHHPDWRVIEFDEVSLLAQGQRIEHNGALFTGVYGFGAYAEDFI
jgi:hypothetical protein